MKKNSQRQLGNVMGRCRLRRHGHVECKGMHWIMHQVAGGKTVLGGC